MSIASDKNLAAFLDETAYTVRVTLLDSNPGHPQNNAKEYTYITNIPGIKLGDLLLVEGGGTRLVLTEAMSDLRVILAQSRADSETKYDSSFEMGDSPQALATISTPKAVRVVSVEDGVRIAPGDPWAYKWIIGKIDLSYYGKLLSRNEALARTVSDAYKQAARVSVRTQLLGMLAPEEVAKVSGLLGSNQSAAEAHPEPQVPKAPPAPRPVVPGSSSADDIVF